MPSSAWKGSNWLRESISKGTVEGSPERVCTTHPWATRVLEIAAFRFREERTAGEHGSENFAKYLCNQYHP